MINLKHKDFISFEGVLDLLDDSKKPRNILEPIFKQKMVLRSRVAEYLVNRRYLERLSENRRIFNPDISRELKDCYENMPAELSSNVTEQHKKLLHGLHVCPYCLISEADTKDHYLPKETFPEYAFLVWNLIPCCTNCNRRKGMVWVDQGKRVFFNPLFDVLPERFLGVSISLSEKSVNFYLIEQNGIISSHIEKLKIVDRYNAQGSGVLSQILTLIHVYDEMRDDEIFRSYMEIECVKHSHRFGKNHYLSLIYERLAQVGLADGY